MEEAWKKGLEGMYPYLIWMNDKLKMLSELKKPELSEPKRILLDVLITLNVAHRNFLQDVMIPNTEALGFPMGT